VFRRHLHDRVHAETVELESASRVADIGLVDGKNNRDTEHPDSLSDFLVGRDQPLPSVHDEDDQVRCFECLQAVFDHKVMQGIGRGPKEASGVD
jgi:hypothetical protein